MLGTYVRENYTEKQEASGWPVGCNSEEDRKQYLDDYEKRMGCKLNPSKIEKNPGRRSNSKLRMNSLYGKFAQKANMPKCLTTNKRSDCWDLMNDPQIEILSLDIIDDMFIWMYKFVDDSLCDPGNTSVIVAAFITAYARLSLIRELMKIDESGQEVLYADTDSIVFVHKPGKYLPEIGEYIGQMSDEIVGEYVIGAKITEFYSTGPKSYIFSFLPDGSEKTKIKSKGLKLYLETFKTLSFDEIKDKAVDKSNGLQTMSTIFKQTQFSLDRQHFVNK